MSEIQIEKLCVIVQLNNGKAHQVVFQNKFTRRAIIEVIETYEKAVNINEEPESFTLESRAKEQGE